MDDAVPAIGICISKFIGLGHLAAILRCEAVEAEGAVAVVGIRDQIPAITRKNKVIEGILDLDRNAKAVFDHRSLFVQNVDVLNADRVFSGTPVRKSPFPPDFETRSADGEYQVRVIEHYFTKDCARRIHVYAGVDEFPFAVEYTVFDKRHYLEQGRYALAVAAVESISFLKVQEFFGCRVVGAGRIGGEIDEIKILRVVVCPVIVWFFAPDQAIQGHHVRALDQFKRIPPDGERVNAGPGVSPGIERPDLADHMANPYR